MFIMLNLGLFMCRLCTPPTHHCIDSRKGAILFPLVVRGN